MAGNGPTEAGRAFVFGSNIDTDLLAPGTWIKETIPVIAEHCLEAVDPSFASSVRPGDVVVGSSGFGIGSSRQQAAEALKHLGVQLILAKSYGSIFYRNALNIGLPALVCAETDRISAGDMVRADLATGEIFNETTGETLKSEPLPEFLRDIIADGGLIEHLEKKLAAKRDLAGTSG